MSSKSIPFKAFRNDKGITSFTIPTGATAVGREAFALCENLTEVSGLEKVKVMYSSAFEESGLKEVHLGGNLEIIPASCFCKCQKLERIQLDYGIKRIGAYAFAKCDNLKEIVIPESVTYIGESWKEL